MKLIPKNWVNFQHYKHRSPPWIKLHKNLLDDMQYQRLPIASKALAPMLWLLASESVNGEIDKSIDEIAFRLRMSEKDLENAIKPLIINGFFIDASNMLASSLQDATSETERETEKEKETKKEIVTPDGVSVDLWKDFLAHRKRLKANVTPRVVDMLIKEAQKANMALSDVIELILFKGWRSFEAEWVKNGNNQPKIDKSWQFSDAGIENKAKELGISTMGLTYQQVKEKCLLVMAKRALQ